METFLLLTLLPIITTYYFLFGTAALAIASEYFECTKFSAFISLFFVASLLLITGLTPFLLLMYIPIGITFAIWRWKIWTERKTEFWSSKWNEYKEENVRIRLVADVNLKKNIGRVVGWVFSWPLAFVQHVVGDLIHSIKNFILNNLGGVFGKYSDAALAKFDEQKETK